MTDSNRTFMDRQNDVVIEDILLSTEGASEPLSIKGMVGSISIFEDITKHFMEGSILISDGQNIIDKVPFTGREFITITYRTPIEEELRTIQMRLYGQATRVRPADSKIDTIKLKMISEAGYVDSLNQISEKFDGDNSEIVNDLIDRFYPAKENTIDETDSTKFKYVFPFQRPSQMIKQIAENSVPKNSKSPFENTGYLFFETLNNYVFSPINFLINKDPKGYFSDIDSLRLSATPVSQDSRYHFSDRSVAMPQKVIGGVAFDRMTQIKNGGFSNTNYFHDMTTKEWGKENFSYSEDSNSYADFEPKTISDQIELVPRKKIINDSDNANTLPSVVNLFPRHSKVQGDDYGFNSVDYEIRRFRNSNFLCIGDMEYKLEVSGSSQLSAGDTVYLKVVKNAPESELKISDVDEEKTGVYLIKSLHHFFVVGDEEYTTYKTSMRIVKNYRVNEIPSVGNLQFEGVKNA
mgnify:FL=1